MKHQDIKFKTRRIQAMENKEQNNGKIGKEPNATNPETTFNHSSTCSTKRNESDKWKAVFLMNKGLFKQQVMYFGLCNSPGTFQRMMNSIF